MLFSIKNIEKIKPYISTLCFFYLMHTRTLFKSPIADLIFTICYFVFVFFLLERNQPSNNIRYVKIGCAAFAFLFSIVLLIETHVIFTGQITDSYNKNYIIPFDWTDIFGFVIRFIAVYPPVLIIVSHAVGFFNLSEKIFTVLFDRISVERPRPQISDTVFFLVSFAFLTIPWFFGFLHFFPGNIIYADIIYILLNNPVQASWVSPIWFNYLVYFFLNKGIISGHPNGGTALFCLFQMTIFGLISAYILLWMRKKGAGKFLIFPMYLFYAFYPIISIYTFSILKDVWYSYVMLLWIPFLFDSIREREFTLNRCITCILLLFFTMAFRNNGVLVAVMMVPILTLLFHNKRTVVFMIGTCTVILVLCGSHILSKGVQHRLAESIGIPLQQIGMVMTHKDGKMTEQERQFIAQILPEECWIGDEYFRYYAPMSVDSIKYNADGKFDDMFISNHRKDFARVYLTLFLRNPGLFVKAWLIGTYGFWAFGTMNDNQVYYATIEKNEFGIFQQSKLPKKIDDLVVGIYSYLPHSEGSAGTYIWIIFFVCLIFMLNREGWFAIVFLPVILNWLTLMAASPIAFGFRYVYYYLLILPLILPIMYFIFRTEK